MDETVTGRTREGDMQTALAILGWIAIWAGFFVFAALMVRGQ